MAPPSSGGIALIQILNILENVDLSSFDHNSEEYLKILISAMDYAYKDRAEYLGDPSFFDVPQNLLTSKKYAKKIYKLIQKEKLPTKATINIIESDETTHFSILDKWGNAVSNTYTLNTAYGSGIIPTGTGILMNNEMDDFSSKPGYPNAYGLIGSEANKIEPKKTPLSSMSPVIVFNDNKPFLITGSPGGSTIITSVLQEILNVLDFQYSLEESSKKSRIHYQHLPNILFHEKLEDNLIKSLRKDRKLMNRKLGETHSILQKKMASRHFLTKEDQMEKQAQFTSKKLLFDRSTDFPELPGVYKFYNSKHQVIYIGKAKNIKNRVKSYLNLRKDDGKRITKLKSSIKFIETIITKTESDALILEQGLISKKDHYLIYSLGMTNLIQQYICQPLKISLQYMFLGKKTLII